MNKKRLLELAGMVPLYEDFSDSEHYKKKNSEKQKFEGRTIVVTDLYDGDVFGYLGNSRFVVSSPLWRGEAGPGHVDEDEVEVSDVDHALSSKDIAFLKRWTLDELNEMHHEENEDEELPVTSSTGYEDTFKNEEEESAFGTMTRESFKDIGKSVGMAYDRVLGDLKRGRGREELVIAVEEEALDLVERQCDDVIRRLGQQVNKEISDKQQR